jgi:hypothetical protein
MSVPVSTSVTKPKIFIYISDVASYIGQNKWDYVTPFERLWKKCDMEKYNLIINSKNMEIESFNIELSNIQLEKSNLQHELDSKKITSRQFSLQTKKIESREEIIQKEIKKIEQRVDDIHLTQKEKLEKVIGNELIEQINSNSIETSSKRDAFDKKLSSLDLSEDKLKEIKTHGESYINKTHGTLKEETAIEMYENKFNVKLDTSQKLNKLYLHELSINSDFHWFICGKVDGLYMGNNQKENYIVEVKNRTRGFFNTLRDYEKTQIHLYMHMLSIKRSKLVEKYENKLRITDIYENTDYTNEIIESLSIFISLFEKKFLQNDKAKQDYLLKSNDDKQKYIHRTFFVPIQKYLESKMIIEESESNGNNKECLIDDLD